jgi:hypothetical protein
MCQTLRRVSSAIALVLLAAMLLACGGAPPPSQWAEAQQETKDKAAVSKEALDGKAFNKFFPKVQPPYDLVYEQDKKGTAIANLKKDGKEVAKLSVTDTISNPETAEKYTDAAGMLAGYPHTKVASHAYGVLIGDRIQVQVKSMDDSFPDKDCDEWIQKFDLDGISKLVK